MSVIIPVIDDGVRIIEQCPPAEDRKFHFALYGSCKRLHAGAFQHDRADIRVLFDKSCGTADHLFFRFVIIGFRNRRTFPGIPEVVEFRDPVFILGAGNDVIAARVDPYVRKMFL